MGILYVEASHQGHPQGPYAMHCIRHGVSDCIMAPERRLIDENRSSEPKFRLLMAWRWRTLRQAMAR
jgi:hypothetical protein